MSSGFFSRDFLSQTLSGCAKVFITFYQCTLGYFVGGNCRFYPSCSAYAKECFEKHDFSTAASLTVKRVCSCHPFSNKRQLFDPVPEKIERIK